MVKVIVGSYDKIQHATNLALGAKTWYSEQKLYLVSLHAQVATFPSYITHINNYYS